VLDINLLALSITSTKTWTGNTLFDQISACIIVFMNMIFIAVIQFCECFQLLIKAVSLVYKFFFYFHEITVIEIRTIITNACTYKTK